MVESLMGFDGGHSGPRRLERAGGEEVRAGLPTVIEREPAPDEPGRLSVAFGDDRLRSDGMAVRHAPPGLDVSQPTSEVGHLRSPGHSIVRFPAVRGFELLLR